VRITESKGAHGLRALPARRKSCRFDGPRPTKASLTNLLRYRGIAVPVSPFSRDTKPFAVAPASPYAKQSCCAIAYDRLAPGFGETEIHEALVESHDGQVCRFGGAQWIRSFRAGVWREERSRRGGGAYP
jgi:hypothetical protein